MTLPDTSQLGARLTPNGARFGLWAPTATAVELVLVDRLNRQTGIDMAPNGNGCWRVEVDGIGHGQLYGFRVHGQWSPWEGKRFNPAKILLDPYAKVVVGGLDYEGPIYGHRAEDHHAASLEDSLGSVPLGMVIEQTPPPKPIARRRPMSETIIYEAHLRGMTKLHPGVPAKLRGTYLGMAQPVVIDHLLKLGITAIEFLPLHQFVWEPFVANKGLRNYWGYNSIGFFAPHASYVERGTIGTQVEDFKTMVSALHDAGIEVLLDVVYNHTGEGGQDGPTMSLRGIGNREYYRLDNDHRLDYDVTGCGNSVNTSNPMVRHLILDSLRYWVQEMGVDGFRFDLATTLIRDEHHHVDHQHPFKAELAADPVFDDIKIIAEPWDIGPYGYQVGAWGPGWHEWNDRFRDHIRDYWRGAVHGVQELATRLAGSPDLFDQPGRTPQASINYVTAHDGFTMRDLVSYDIKHNLGNGEGNRDGADNNRSWNHGWEGETTNPQINALRRRQVLNLMATQLLAAGTPMVLAGDEFGRTQGGNNNAYCQDSATSWVNWDIPQQWRLVQDRIAALIELRQRHSVLRPVEFAHHSEVLNQAGEQLGRVDLAWLDGQGAEMNHESWHDGNRRLLGKYVSNPDEAFLSWFNSAAAPIQVQLPGLPWGHSYEIVWHSADETELPSGPLAPGATFELPARCVAVMRVEVPKKAAELLAS